MNFVDNVEISAKAGRGGDGKMSFRREIFVAKGGPDGGDGGHGGDIIFRASRNQDTLTTFRYQKEIRAEDGQPGDRRRKHGKTGQDLIVDVPVGTVVSDESDQVLADLTKDGQVETVLRGGNGGFGNAHFVSSTRQAPNFAEKGEPGEAKTLKLEIKMIADVALVGLPNAGKSTFLARVSNASPEIANYPFTTLTPNLGVADIDKSSSLLIADIPGLISGAAEGKGLGHDFLRHIERTKVVLHLIDAYSDDVAKSYQTVRDELIAYSPKLAKKTEVISLTKIEGLDSEIIDDEIASLKKVAKKGTRIEPISSASGQGINDLLYTLKDLVSKANAKKPARKPEEELVVLKITDTKDAWKLTKDKDVYIIRGDSIERFARRTDFNNEQGLNRLKDIMRRLGIMHELRRKKVQAGDKVQIGVDPSNTFKY
ncbi:MAG TPA: GTPase ObgE [Candidatus Sulfotelmatobacter sp.]|nr:GTPase ObgE [Candidatus Sulfotelmatobacter sp.]